MSTHVEGTVAPGFEAVRDAFQNNFDRMGEVGAGVCVYRDGERVVDLWGGSADVASGRAWDADTRGVLFSCTKGLAALCLLILADRGRLDYDEKVATYWPGFAKNGKADITVRTLINHRGGLCALDAPLTIDDFADRPDAVLQACEAQAPRWPQGTDQGYHAATFGPFVSELFTRITGETLGTFLKREVADRLGADVLLGLSDDDARDIATLYPPTLKDKLTKGLPKLLFDRGRDGRMYRRAVQSKSDTACAFANPKDLGAAGLGNYNSPRVHGLELAWANAIGSARGLSRVYAALAQGGELDGVRLVSAASIEPIKARQSWVERDRVLRKPQGWSQGFLKEETSLFSPAPESFGHPGAGGALGWCDPVNKLSIGYVMNKMGTQVRSSRALALCHAVYASVGIK